MMGPVERDPPDSRSSWATIVGSILEEARRRAGKGPALALRLEQLGVVGEKGERYSESSISNWIRGRAKPPAEVVLAAAQAADISLDDRLGIGHRASGLERQLYDVQAELAQQRSNSAAMERRLEDLAARLEASGSHRGASAESGSEIRTGLEPAEAETSVQHVEQSLSALERDVQAVGEQLSRPWDQGISYTDLASSLGERFQRRVGALEARVAELAGMVGAHYGGYPAAPGPSAVDHLRLTWAVEVIGMLNEQMVEVRRRAETLAHDSAIRRRSGDSAR